MVIRIIFVWSAIYIILLLYVYFNQRSMMYFPDSSMPNLEEHKALDAQIITVKTMDGLSLTGWYFPPERDDKKTLIYFHGNASSGLARMPRVRPYIDQGYGVLLTEYRGYSGNPGHPSEQGLYNDGRAFTDFVKKQSGEPGIIFYGESLGGGVAVQMATEYNEAALILEAPFTSAVDVAQRRYFYFPVKALMKDRFKNIKKIDRINAPLLIVHGTNDRTVPYDFGRALYNVARDPKQFVSLEGAGHNDVYLYGTAQHVLEFMEDLSSPKD